MRSVDDPPSVSSREGTSMRPKHRFHPGGVCQRALGSVYLTALAGAAGVLASLLLAAPARALFHVALIQEVAVRVGGDPSQQFVEMRMLAPFQNFVRNSVLATFDAEGNYLEDLLVVPANVANDGAEVRWVMATAALQSAHAFTADFTIEPRLPLGGGMICWGAPGFIPPADPASWERTNFANYVDCLAYGTYAGPTNLHVGTPTPLRPEGHSAARIDDTENNAANFSCAATLTPENNAGEALSLPATEACSSPAGFVGGGGPAKTDCLLEWAILNAPDGTKPTQSCTEGASCDRSPEPGCQLSVQVCLNAHDTSLEACAADAATAFRLKRPKVGGTAATTANALLDAVAALGGVRDGDTVSFAPALPGTNRCTPPVEVDVPLKERGGRQRTGKLLLKAKHAGTISGRNQRDTDVLKLFCRPASDGQE